MPQRRANPSSSSALRAPSFGSLFEPFAILLECAIPAEELPGEARRVK
jgi:hypothetical protein